MNEVTRTITIPSHACTLHTISPQLSCDEPCLHCHGSYLLGRLVLWRESCHADAAGISWSAIRLLPESGRHCSQRRGYVVVCPCKAPVRNVTSSQVADDARARRGDIKAHFLFPSAADVHTTLHSSTQCLLSNCAVLFNSLEQAAGKVPANQTCQLEGPHTNSINKTMKGQKRKRFCTSD